MQRILITGSRSALGFYLKRTLLERNASQQNEVFGISRNPDNEAIRHGFREIQADLLDDISMQNVLADIKPDKIFHLAWETAHGSYWNDPANNEWSEVSIELANRFCSQGGHYFGFAGTCAEYAWGDKVLDEESSPEEPNTLYGREKLRTTRTLLTLAETTQTVFGCGRIFFPFCPLENENRISSLLIRQILEGKKLHLHSGDVYRSICHTRHVAEAMCNMADSLAGGVFNLVPQNCTHLGRFLKAVAIKMGAESSITWDDWGAGDARNAENESDPRYICAAGIKAKPYFPANVNLEKDIAEFVNESAKRFS